MEFIIIIKVFYLLLPAAFANMAPLFFKNLNFLNYPIDFKQKILNKRMLGDNKTWRGLFFGIIFSIIITFFQQIIYLKGVTSIYFFDYTEISFILLGFLFGLGALFGDLVESFFKRRINFKPGKPLLFLDQTDWVIGSLIFIMPIYVVSLKVFLISLVLFFLLHIITKYFGYHLNIDKTKY